MSFIVLFKANSWSSSVNEIEGVVTDSKGKVVHSIFGKWHESIFQGDPPTAMCIWRASEGFFFSHTDFTQPDGTFITLCVCVFQIPCHLTKSSTMASLSLQWN